MEDYARVTQITAINQKILKKAEKEDLVNLCTDLSHTIHSISELNSTVSEV
jgi:hypothetical protein